MLPVNRNLVIYKGDTYGLSFRLREKDQYGQPGNPVDLTGATGKAQIRTTEADTTVMAEFTVSIPDQAIAANKGVVNLSLPHTVTGADTFTNGVWDVQITFADGSVKTFLRGNVTATKEVTRA